MIESHTAAAHRDYHTEFGWDTCPWDCYEVEARNEELAERWEEELEAVKAGARTVTCGRCKEAHTVEGVRLCHGYRR